MAKIRMGGYQPERSVHTRAARLICADIAQRLGADMHAELIPDIAATGRPTSDLLQMTEQGELDLCYFASSYLAGRVPELSILDLPFEGGGRERIAAKLDGVCGRRLQDAVAARTGFKVLGFWDNGIRHVSNRVRAIRVPADCTGLSIRTLDNRFHQAIFAALGFVPRFIDVKDLEQAVASGSIDAQENPLTNMVNFDVHKTHRHVTLLGQFCGIALLLANRREHESRPAVERAAIEAAAATATVMQRRMAAEEDAQCLALIVAAGVDVVPQEAVDIAAFKSTIATVVAREMSALPADLLEAWRG